MKTQAKNKLQFNKQNIIELNDANMSTINGGTDTISTLQCIADEANTSLGSIIPPRPTSLICSVLIIEDFGG